MKSDNAAVVATMLVLRRVPLFARLGPDDLHRIALAARQEFFDTGQSLIVEGNLDSALYLLVAGSVRVIHVEPDGTERLLRRYTEGDHIGELAVLRHQPRVASVIADGPVSALVLDGEALTAVLRERPDAAMALLATLADRIAAQP